MDSNWSLLLSDFGGHLGPPAWIQDVVKSRHYFPDTVFIALDKDGKRRARMDWRGYMLRMYVNFFHDKKYYRPRPELTPQDVASRKQLNIHKFLPDAWCPRWPVQIEACPWPKLTYKSKCLHKGPQTGLACGKQHAHEREIVDNSKEPTKKYMALAARALRLCKKLSGDPGWTLWNQMDVAVAVEAQLRFSKLKVHPSFLDKRPCNSRKPSTLTLVRVDASQFFKAADAKRGLRRAQALLDRLALHKRRDSSW